MSAAPATAAAPRRTLPYRQSSISSGGNARGCASGRVDERRLQAARQPIRAVGAQGRLGRDGELGLGGGHLVDVQALGLDRHGARALEGVVALGALSSRTSSLPESTPETVTRPSSPVVTVALPLHPTCRRPPVCDRGRRRCSGPPQQAACRRRCRAW